MFEDLFRSRIIRFSHNNYKLWFLLLMFCMILSFYESSQKSLAICFLFTLKNI